MANAKEKQLLGLAANATDDQCEQRITELIEQATANNAVRHTIAIIPRTSKDRPRGGIKFPGDRVTVLDLAALQSTHEGRQALGAMEGDADLIVARSDGELTPESAINRYTSAK